MTQKQQPDHFISTYARTLLSDWYVLAHLVRKHSALLKDGGFNPEEDDTQKPAALSLRQINDVLHGPLHTFFKNSMSAYARIARLQMELNIRENDLFKGQRQTTEDLTPIDPELLTQISLNQLDELQKQLNALIAQQETSWDTSIDEWKTQLMTELATQGITVADIEITEMQGREPISELMNRLTDLKIELPKYNKDNMTFAIYLMLKTMVVIQSALSRQHQPHAMTDINKVLKKLNATFKKISSEETKLIAEQKAAVQAIMKPIL